MPGDRTYEEVMAAWGASTDGRHEIAWVWDEVIAARRERDEAVADKDAVLEREAEFVTQRDAALARAERAEAERDGARVHSAAMKQAAEKIGDDMRRNFAPAYAAGVGYLVTCETHDAQDWWSLDGLCPYCVADGLPGVALADQRVDIAEVVKQHDAALARAATAHQDWTASVLVAQTRAAERDAAERLERLATEGLATAAEVADERDAALARAERAEAEVERHKRGENDRCD